MWGWFSGVFALMFDNVVPSAFIWSFCLLLTDTFFNIAFGHVGLKFWRGK